MAAEARRAEDRELTVVYVVLSHENPRQILRLVSCLLEGDPNGQVIVQHDSARCALDPGIYEPDRRVHFMAPTAPRRWGRWPVAECMIQALSWALDNVEFDWLTVLSGQDYPVQPLSSFKAQLVGSEYDAFVRAEPVGPTRPLARENHARYMQARHYFRWYELPGVLLRWSARSPKAARLVQGLQRRISFAQPLVFLWSLPRGGGDMIGFRRLRPPFDDGFACYSGSQWLTISRRAAALIQCFLREHPDVVALYRTSILADESLLNTILCNSSDLRVCRENHHYLRMAGLSQAHPAILRSQDLDRLVTSGKPFARKFDDREDGKILDLLDARLASGHS